MQKNIILASFKQSIALIRKNKPLFFLLLTLQIIFFIIFSFINFKYTTKILESAKEISDYLSQQKLDEISVGQNILEQKNILGDEALMISRNFNDIVRNLKWYLAYIFILFVVFISTAWTVTHKLIYGIDFKRLIKNFIRIFIVSFVYLGLIFSFFFYVLNVSFTQAVEVPKPFLKYAPFLIFSAILAYFMFVSIALSHKTKLANIVQRTLSIGIKKLHYISSVYFINIFLFTISIFLFYYFIERNLFILLLSLILMIFSFVFGRILLVNVVEKLIN